jgi:hypothetical protein
MPLRKSTGSPTKVWTKLKADGRAENRRPRGRSAAGREQHRASESRHRQQLCASRSEVLGIDGESEDASVKLVHNNPQKWMDLEVPKILAEFENEQGA